MKDKKFYRALSATRWGKPLLTALGTIFLGAIGSGLWDAFLRDFISLLAFALLKLIGSVYSGYLDGLHANIAKGCVDRFSALPYVLIVTFICIFPWMAIRMLRHQVQSISAQYVKPTQTFEVITTDAMVADLKKTLSRFTMIMSILAIFVSTAYIAIAARDVYANGGAI